MRTIYATDRSDVTNAVNDNIYTIIDTYSMHITVSVTENFCNDM